MKENLHKERTDWHVPYSYGDKTAEKWFKKELQDDTSRPSHLNIRDNCGEVVGFIYYNPRKVLCWKSSLFEHNQGHGGKFLMNGEYFKSLDNFLDVYGERETPRTPEEILEHERNNTPTSKEMAWMRLKNYFIPA